jgi:hypothetical protein
VEIRSLQDQPEGSKNIVPLGLELGLALSGISPFGSFFWFFVFQRFFDTSPFLIFSLDDPPKTVGIKN